MCSLSASPVPTPKPNRPSSIEAAVAAACATTAGWIRSVGQVTAVWSRSVDVAREMPPRTAQTNGELPCASIQGW